MQLNIIWNFTDKGQSQVCDTSKSSIIGGVVKMGYIYCRDNINLCPEDMYCDGVIHYCEPCSYVCHGEMPDMALCISKCQGKWMF